MHQLKTVTAIRSAIEKSEITLSQLVGHYLHEIKANEHLNAFVEVFEAEALQQAAIIQKKIIAKTAGKLAGMVLSIKDNICYKDHKVSAGSRILEHYISPFSATLVERLLNEDAIIIGRTNCDEFAMGASNESSYYGPVKNAQDTTRVSGGSSGGAAVAVQAGLCTASIGTDTGGSVRQPASFCGIVGFKPSYGRISRWGMIAFGSSLDQAGPMTNSVEDAALLYEVMAGPDEKDSTLPEIEVKFFNRKTKPKSLRIAYLPEIFDGHGVDRDIQDAIGLTIGRLRNDGHVIEEVPFPLLDYMVPSYYILAMAEASSNLSRYDGVRYGYRSDQLSTLDDMYKYSRSEGFGKEVKRRIMLGTFVLSAGYYDAYYAKAQKVRMLITRETEKILAKYDVLLTPTAPTPAFSIGEKIADPVTMYLSDVFTVQASLSGLPAISLPMGNNNSNMPFGLQLLGRRYAEDELLAVSKYILDLNAN